RLAVQKGHSSVVAALVEGGARVNTRADKQSPSLLNLAVRNCNGAAVKLLIEKGADVNATAERGAPEEMMSPLRAAIEKGSVEMVRLLLDGKASFNDADTLSALKKNNLEIVTLLVEKGASPDARDEGGTLLHHAIKNGDVKCLKVLLAKKAK